ncbi:MAG: FIST N-terminal domain-containing protein [Myxococcota bacterium]
MQLEQRLWTPQDGWGKSRGGLSAPAELVLLFGGTSVFSEPQRLAELRERYPGACLFGCSTAGEICDTRVHDDSLSVTAVHFEYTTIHAAHVCLDDYGGSSTAAGAQLAQALPAQGLRHVFTLSDGQRVNGSDLVRGMYSELPDGVQVTGGLAGDGARFDRTLVLAEGEPRQGVIAAMGLYGNALRIGYGSLGGWDSFGPKRTVAKSKGNVLYELDGKPALELYKRYLGDHATGLPATGLLFPLEIQRPGEERSVVRTILAVDEAEQSLTFAGDVPEGSVAQLMKANFERLIDGAADAAKASVQTLGGDPPAELAVLISCVGRKLVLKQRTEEEVEGVRGVLGRGPMLTGFYSYGEICPAAPDASGELHNQTMTITTFHEHGP